MGKAQAVAAPAVAAKPTKETVHEYVLRRRQADGDGVPLLSDHDLDVVKQAKVNAVAQAVANGQHRPDLFITDRKCTFPLSASGKRLGEGSTCEETEI